MHPLGLGLGLGLSGLSAFMLSVTGSGFWHNTSGALDAAASHGTAGQMAFTNVAGTDAVWGTVGGDLLSSATVLGQLNISKIGSLAGGTVTVGNGTAGVTFTGAAATSGAGLNMTFTPSAATTTGANGSAVFNFGAPASGTVEGALLVNRSGNAMVGLQALVSSPTIGALYIYGSAAGDLLPTAFNYALATDGNGRLLVNSPNNTSGVANGYIQNGGAAVANWGRGGLGIGTNGSLYTGNTSGNNQLGFSDSSSVDTVALASCIKVFSNANALTAVHASGLVKTLSPVMSGTHNSQAQQIGGLAGMVELTHGAAATTVVTVPLATSGTSVVLGVTAIGRATTLFTGGAAGDSWSTWQQFLVRNVAGTLTTVAQVTAGGSTQSDTSMSTCALSISLSGTNILVQITPPSVAAGVGDFTCVVDTVVN